MTSYTPLLVGAGAGALAWIFRTGANSTKEFTRDYWSGCAIAIALCFLAYLTNPNPASFRTHLTSLSFHTHLRRLSSASPSRGSNSTPSTSATSSAGTSTTPIPNQQGSGNASSGKTKKGHGKNPSSNSSTSSTSTSSPTTSMNDRHVLSFSNRISLSVKTPSYNFTSYHLFSTVFVPSARPIHSTPTPNSSSTTNPSGKKPTRPVSSRSNTKNVELNALLGLEGELWLGVFGRWYALKWWEGEEIEEEERRGRLESGVREIMVEDHQVPSAPSLPYTSTVPHTSSPLSRDASRSDHNSSSTHPSQSTPPQSPSTASPTSNPASRSTSASNNATTTSTSSSVSVSKRIFRAGQRRSSPTSLTRLRTKAENAQREKDEAELLAQKNGNGGVDTVKEGETGRGGGGGGQGGSSRSNSPSRFFGTSDKSSGSVGGGGSQEGNGGGGAAGGGTPDPILVELQLQLEELRHTTADSEKRLQEELEVLRGKKRDEDQFRVELKAKTKGLEEAKRLADASRTDAEKELNERKSVVKEVQRRVEKLREEIAKLERKEMEQVERKEKKKRERKEREKKLADDVGKKKDELKDREKGLEEVMQKVNEMEKKLDVRRALLATRRNELAQLAGMVAARNGLGGAPPMYAMPPHPSNATLGGPISGPFAMPFGQGAYGRRNYPYVHPLSATSSRPTSIRSGHYDPHTGTFQSAPSSPTLSHPVSPLDDPSPYASQSAIDQNGGWPSSYPTAPNSTASTLPQTGFLEHRLQHRATNPYPSVDDVPSHFLPFDLGEAAASDSNPMASDEYSPGGSTHASKSRTLALPMQYLDSGLLAGSQSPGTDGPLSPMTPHQTSLIPSQLFQLLDDDDNDDFVMPDSPTLRSHFGSMSEWEGLGLDVDGMAGRVGGSRRASEEEKAKEELEAVKEETTEEDEFHEVPEETSNAVSNASYLTLRPDLFPSNGHHSATTSPLGPPPTSPFTPWDSNSSPTVSSLPPPGFTSENAGVIGSNILHRLSPSQDLSDDLPRAGLSLNPDAKAFAFPFSQQQHARTASVPSPTAIAAALGGATQLVRNGRSASSVTSSSFVVGGGTGTSSALPSPTVSSYPAPIEPPSKSRMDFASSSSAAPLSARYTPPFDWPRSSSSPKFSAAPGSGSPVGSSSNVGGGGGGGGGGTASGFNPFDEEDSLLGPLKR